MTHSLLCETVTGDTMAELIAARRRAAEADMVELRLDGVRDLDVAQALHGRRTPVIVTCRPAWKGVDLSAARKSGAPCWRGRWRLELSTWTSNGGRGSTI